MHELALLTSVVHAVEEACGQAHASAVQVVALQVGALCGAEPAALNWAWPLAIAGSLVQDARLILEEVPAAVWCPACDQDREIDEFFALRCPVCAEPTANLVRGREFQVAYIELEVGDDEFEVNNHI